MRGALAPAEIGGEGAGRSCQISRRAFLQSTGGAFAAYPLAKWLLMPAARSLRLTSQADSPNGAIHSFAVKYPAEGATLAGYLGRPMAGGLFPGLIVIPGGEGLSEPMRDVARRFASQGFVALCIDPLSRHGGTASFTAPADVAKTISGLSESRATADFHAALRYLKAHDSVRADRIGVIGLGWGKKHIRDNDR